MVEGKNHELMKVMLRLMKVMLDQFLNGSSIN